MKHIQTVTVLFIMTLLALPYSNVFAGDLKKGSCDWKNKNEVIKDKHPYVYGLEDRLYYESGIYLQYRDDLVLTDEQFESIIDIKSTAKKDLILKKAQISAIKVDIHSELEKNRMDVDVIKEYMKKKHDLEAQHSIALIEHYDNLRSILKDEQKNKLDKIYNSNGKICPKSEKGKNS